MANDFLTFAGDPGANVMTQAAYAALAARGAGFSSGVAQSAQLNKVWRQSSIIAATLAQFIADNSGGNAVDDGTITTLLANLKIAISKAGITQPQFDNDTDYATTAFVQRALGNFAGQTSINSLPATLQSTAAGTRIVVSPAANGTLTMPLRASCPTGSQFYIFNNTGFTITIAFQGGETVSTFGQVMATMTLGPYSTIKLSTGTVTWVCEDGLGAMKYSQEFQASLATNGYQKLPSGLIIQWGSQGAVGTGGVTVTFPIAYPNAQLVTVPQVSVPSGPVTQYVNAVNTGTPKASVILAINTGSAAVGWISIGY